MNFLKFILILKKEILGTDIKAFLNHEDFKVNSKNDPRIFANTMKSNDKESSFGKSVFTLCQFKKVKNVLLGPCKLVK